MNWKTYEKEILAYFQETYPDTTISFDQKIVGRYSKVERQIDVLIEGEIAGYEIRIIVDCKHFSKNIDVKQVESFCSMVDDVDGHQGVLITRKGFSKAAINRAYYGDSKIELDIINFDDLHEYQSFTAVPYVGHFSVIVPAPFGWVLDLKDKINSFATLHQRGRTLKQARKRNEWMYMQFWEIESPDFGIEQLIGIQNDNILSVDPKAKFTYNSAVKRKDGLATKIRIADTVAQPVLEIAGFIQFEKNIFFIVLFTPKELLKKNLRKLQHLLQVAVPCEISFDNHAIIKEALIGVESIKDKQEQSENYFQVGLWFEEMDDLNNAFANFKKAIDCFPTHYSLLKRTIGKALRFGLIEEARFYATHLFQIEPKNPTVLQTWIDVYFEQKKPNELIPVFEQLIAENDDSEILGNLNFHFGLLYLNLDNSDDAARYMNIAKRNFQKSLPDNHQVFKSLAEFEKILNDHK